MDGEVNMKRFWIVVAVAVGITLTAFRTHAAATEARLGVVNVQEVLDSIEDGKKAKSQMEKAITERKRDLETKQKDYQKLQDDFEKQKLILSPSALQDKQKELATKLNELQKLSVVAQQDMHQKEMELLDGILKKIRSVVAKIGQEGGYSFIWEKNEGGVVYYKDAFDVTKQVIDQYNKVYKNK